MKMELTGALLSLALLCGTSVALADEGKTRGASSEYAWETQEASDNLTTLFRVTSCQPSSTVLVHVEQSEHDEYCHDADRAHSQKSRHGNEPRGVILRGCSDECGLFVREGETVQCVVEPGKRGLRAQSTSHRRHKGTLQIINI